MDGIETPFPVQGTITPQENGYRASLDAAYEWVSETENGDLLQRAVDCAAWKYGTGTEVHVQFTADGHGVCTDFQLLGEADDSMASRALDINEGDTFELSFITDGEEQTTRQRVVDVTSQPAVTTIYGEEAPGWNGPSVGLVVETYSDTMSLKDELRHPMHDPTAVDELTELIVNPAEAEA